MPTGIYTRTKEHGKKISEALRKIENFGKWGIGRKVSSAIKGNTMSKYFGKPLIK